ncbi:class I SAM-dependent methyltransferase [uncultured Ferrimonas sp.]|uniref:class I SAM-dependent methyltransferase n=1 Tax=uncultured Ferrimonas sp. TaxID=432640 RepID=UPI0026377349|nr:class I SAM-dependent methyltransferase [uncultured Ferrimonas sp.]
MSSNIHFYHQHADRLDAEYGRVSFESVHQDWQAHWPQAGMRVLDVGAGNGRDARFMAQRQCSVIAIEPSKNLRNKGKQHCAALTDGSVQWLDDRLPELTAAQALGIQFDLILVSAVWMHLNASERQRAFRKLAKLLAANGKLVITLRHGDFTDGRSAHPVSVDQISQFAQDQALKIVVETPLGNDQLGRSAVQWQTVVLTLPDDGSGDLTRVRHIIVNDSKSATYKLALLRTLLRIADAHPGAVVDRSDGQVALPLGLVALYWLRQFKRLVDDGQLQQHSNPNTQLGFIKAPWAQLRHLKADDLQIGALFQGKEAQALQQVLGDIIHTIKVGPVAFTYQGNDKSQPYFNILRQRRRKADSVVLDQPFFSRFGQFTLSESLWDCLRLYHSWIEPLVVNQWVNEMRGYARNHDREANLAINLDFYHRHLAWLNPEHNTRAMQQKAAQLEQQGHRIRSVWSGTVLAAHQRHMDHCLPFAYWPNNDDWNLLPSSAQENLKKSARLPSQYRLNASKTRILDWWQLAFAEPTEQRRFFQQASLSLPNLPLGCGEFEAVFEAMSFQCQGVKSRLLVREW